MLKHIVRLFSVYYQTIGQEKEVFKFYSSQLRVNKLVSYFHKCFCNKVFQNSC